MKPTITLWRYQTKGHPMKLSFVYWCWNPNSPDTGGFVKSDWKTVERAKQQLINTLFILLAVALGTPQVSTAAEQKAAHKTPVGYLFAHTTRDDYHRMYYAVSRDGLKWTPLNGHKRVLGREYWGLPEICRAGDGQYYLLGKELTQSTARARSDLSIQRKQRGISLWVSDNMIRWRKSAVLAPKMPAEFGFQPDQTYSYGAPKMFYDEATGQYFITFHTTPVPREKNKEFWNSQRTYYITTKDFQEYSAPQRLMPDYDFATIDVLIRRDGERYFIIMKDERWPAASVPTAKALRVASGPSATGPWSKPSDKISPNWREAPAVVQRIDGKGWYLYFEHYPGRGSNSLTARELGGPWGEVSAAQQAWPDGARHGCVININQSEWDALHKAFGN